MNEGYIFCNPLGGIVEPKTYADLFQRVCANAQVFAVTFHATRHTFATRVLENGMDIKVLPALLRHAQASTTLNRYGHALPDHKAESMRKMTVNYIGRHSGPDKDDLRAEMQENEDSHFSDNSKLIFFHSTSV